MAMTEDEFIELLTSALDLHDTESIDNGEILADDACNIRTFHNAQLLTSNKGIVVKVAGEEFQVTVVRR